MRHARQVCCQMQARSIHWLQSRQSRPSQARPSIKAVTNSSHISTAAVVRRLVSCKMPSFFSTLVIYVLISSSGAMGFCAGCVSQFKSRCVTRRSSAVPIGASTLQTCSTQQSFLKQLAIVMSCLIAVMLQSWQGICQQARSQQQQRQQVGNYR
jgi:hypothetical protein